MILLIKIDTNKINSMEMSVQQRARTCIVVIPRSRPIKIRPSISLAIRGSSTCGAQRQLSEFIHPAIAVLLTANQQSNTTSVKEMVQYFGKYAS